MSRRQPVEMLIDVLTLPAWASVLVAVRRESVAFRHDGQPRLARKPVFAYHRACALSPIGWPALQVGWLQYIETCDFVAYEDANDYREEWAHFPAISSSVLCACCGYDLRRPIRWTTGEAWSVVVDEPTQLEINA